MSSKRKSSSKPLPINGTGEKPMSWYLDFVLVDGALPKKIHLFYGEENESSFKDCGAVESVKEETCGMDMVPCIKVTTEGNQVYLVDPVAFQHGKLINEGEHTMLNGGWLEDNVESGIEYTTTAFVEAFEKVQGFLSNEGNKKNKKKNNTSKKLKETKKDKKDANEQNVEKALVVVETGYQLHGLSPTPIVVDPTPHAILDTIVQPEEDVLDKQIQKNSKNGLDGYMGIEEYFKFGVQFTALIPVEQCEIAPMAYKCRPLSSAYVKYLVKQFAGHSRPNSNTADLMPYDPKTEEPLRSDEVQFEKLDQYHYWILSGQHSIMAARFFLHSGSPKYARRKAFYARRISRIVVNAPMAVAVRISRMENIETQTIMKTQPYVEILKHARGQWLAYNCPDKPKPGVPSEHESRKMWNVSDAIFTSLCLFL